MNRLLYRTLMCMTIGLAGTPALTIAAETKATDDSLVWLTGHWCLASDGMSTEEVWLPPAGGASIGLSRTVQAGRMVAFEFLRIAVVGGVVTYLAQPGGRPATAFKRTDSGDNWIRFENPKHDFPKRVEYRRNGDALRAILAGPGKDGKEKVIPFDYSVCEK